MLHESQAPGQHAASLETPASGPGTIAEDVDSLKAEEVRSEELASPIGATSLSNIGLRLSEEAEKEVEEAMSVSSEGVVW